MFIGEVSQYLWGYPVVRDFILNNKITMKDEIVIYQIDEDAEHLEVRVENETVWLNRQQIASLFDRDIKTIGKHIANVLDEELKGFLVVAKIATTASDGKTYQIEHYNLDMIISVGYRVKSQRGIRFRIWANNILKDYLLKGFSVNNRINRIEDNMEALKNKVNAIDLQINSHLIPTQGVFFDGQVFDAYSFVSDLVRSAKESIVLVDNYIDDTVLTLLSKKESRVKCYILTKNISKQLHLDADKFNMQYPTLQIKPFEKAHDRFLIIDHQDVYHIGASLKDLGKKWFAFSKMDKSSIAIIESIAELL
jgi:hypothetical protein